MKADLRARLFAVTWPADRGFGKPFQADAPVQPTPQERGIVLPPEMAVEARLSLTAAINNRSRT
jgi:hypothetical protein